MSHVCKICSESFSSERSLHAHIKAHGILLSEYYITYYPRYNLYTNELIPFKNKKQYFSTYFSNSSEIDEWAKNTKDEEVQEVILEMLQNRIKEKNLQYAPNHLELILNEMPHIDLYKKYFSSYSAVCRKLDVRPLLHKYIKKEFLTLDKNLEQIEILVDSREQDPLKFTHQRKQKLDFGDYTASSKHYTKTYIERKSETDFKSTMTVGYERFLRELDRVKEFDSYLHIVVESSIDKIIKNNGSGAHKSNLKFVWHQMRVIAHKYPNNCQFIFSGGRTRSKNLIHWLLYQGEEVWGADLQFYIDKRILNI